MSFVFLSPLSYASIRETIKNIPDTLTNPLDHYRNSMGQVDSRLEITEINMSQLVSVIKSMKPTTSTTSDYISVKILKEAGHSISPHLLNLVNSIIKTQEYPSELKLTKIVPIPKDEKDPTSHQGWRPINIVPAISKVVERCLLLQVVNYLKENNLIKHSHHGSVTSKSTQTLVQEIFDNVLESLDKGEDCAIIKLDQSKAYDVISHPILLDKMKILGFSMKTLAIFKNYLNGQRQYVVIDSFPSQPLLVGPTSVTQGSILSCVLYLIFIMDITDIFHSEPHSPEEYYGDDKK